MIWVSIALAGTALLFLPGLLEQFETPKIEIVRLCGWGALAYGLVAGRAGRPARWSALDRAVALWLAVEAVATIFSVSPRVSLVGETRQREGLLTSVALAGLYFAARDAFARPGRTRLACDLILALAAGVAIYAVAQVTGLDPFLWQREATYAGGYVRPFGTLGHPNLLGVMMAAGASLSAGLAIAGGAGAGRWLRRAAALLLSVVTVLTLSRAAWLGLMVGLAVAMTLALRGRGPVRRGGRALAVVAAVVAIGGVILLATGTFDLIAHRFAELLSGGGGSGSSRLEIWRTALAAWRARPWIGNGPDLFEMVFPRFQTAAYWRYEWSGLPFHAHSIYLHALATRGVVGVLAAGAWAVALAVTGAAAWRRRADLEPAGLVPAAAGVVACTAVAGAFGALGIAGALLVVIVSALVASAAETAPAEAAGPERARRDRARRAAVGARARPVPNRDRWSVRRWLAILAAAVAVVAAGLWGLTELRASSAGAAARAFMTRDPVRAVRASRAAVALAPHDDRLWRMHAQTLLWLTAITGAPPGTLDEAERAARRAVDLAPQRAENHIILARALATREAQGDARARGPSAAEFRRTLELAPMDGLSLMEYADHEALLGRGEAALGAARRAVALYPGVGPVWATLGRAWLAAGARDSARAAFERAVGAYWPAAAERAAAEQILNDLRGAGGRAPLVRSRDGR